MTSQPQGDEMEVNPSAGQDVPTIESTAENDVPIAESEGGTQETTKKKEEGRVKRHQMCGPISRYMMMVKQSVIIVAKITSMTRRLMELALYELMLR